MSNLSICHVTAWQGVRRSCWTAAELPPLDLPVCRQSFGCSLAAPLRESGEGASDQGGRLWVVSFSLLAPPYFRVLFLLPGNSCARVYCTARALSHGYVWRRDLKNHGANSTTSLPLSYLRATIVDQ